METVEGVLGRPVEACWNAFVDAPRLPQWVPGMRSAQIVELRDGMPREIAFELVTGTAYALLYDYDLENRTVRWEPKPGTVGGLSGEAHFEATPAGTKLTLSIEQHPGRSFSERSLADAHALIAAFVRWMDAS